MKKNMYGEEIYNTVLRDKIAGENTKIGNKVLGVMDRPYFPRVVVNKAYGIFHYEWSPYGDVDFPDYAENYIRDKMNLWFGVEYQQSL